MNGAACADCRSFNQGRGTKNCLFCQEFKDLIPEKPNPDIIRLPKELLENLNDPAIHLANIFDLISKLDPLSATMLLQSTLLKMTYREISSYHQKLYSKNTCQRKIIDAIEIISRLAVGQAKNI